MMMMMRKLTVQVALVLGAMMLLLLAGTARAQDEARRFIDLKQVPAEGSAAQDFVPRGWKIEGETVEGDLNGDSRPDTVVRLIEDLPEETADGALNIRYRALLILLKSENNRLHRAAAADRLLQCTGCGGMMGNPGGGDITIEKGVLIISQLSGSREVNDLTQRFRYDPRLKRFVLIGEDLNYRDRLTLESETTSSNYLTGVKTFKKTRLDKSGNHEITVASRTQRIPVVKRFIEEIDYEKP